LKRFEDGPVELVEVSSSVRFLDFDIDNIYVGAENNAICCCDFMPNFLSIADATQQRSLAVHTSHPT